LAVQKFWYNFKAKHWKKNMHKFMKYSSELMMNRSTSAKMRKSAMSIRATNAHGITFLLKVVAVYYSYIFNEPSNFSYFSRVAFKSEEI